jgi:predicted DsbA family dithiol-disulfide isomerase
LASTVSVEIRSDVLCPSCYLGKRGEQDLEQARDAS